MSKMTRYLLSLAPSDFRKLLIHYFPKSLITPEILRRFTLSLYESAQEAEYMIYVDPQTWLEEQAEDFATFDKDQGFKF